MRKRNRKPTHPGKVFRIDVLEKLGMTISEAAELMQISRKHLSNFVNERIACSRDLAMRLALATDTSVGSWLNMQTALDVWEAEHDTSEEYQQIRKFAC